MPSASIDFAEAINVAKTMYPDSSTHMSALNVSNNTLFFNLNQRLGLNNILVDVNASTAQGTDGSASNAILGDFNNNGVVNVSDMLELMVMWGSTNPMYDLDNSGTVNTGDLLFIVSAM